MRLVVTLDCYYQPHFLARSETMLGQTEYGQWFQVQQCRNGTWENLQHLEGGVMKFYNLERARRIASSLRVTPGVSDVLIVKVEVSTAYDMVTRQKMLHTVYTGMIEEEIVSRETMGDDSTVASDYDPRQPVGYRSE
jgi:hypothetical protein